MEKAIDMLREYWPWALGIVVGILLISRGGGNQTAMPISYGVSDQRYATDAQLAVASMQAQVETNKIAAERELGLAEIAGSVRYATDTQLALASMQAQVETNKIAAERELGLAEIAGSVRYAEIQREISVTNEVTKGQTNIAIANIAAGVESIYAIADYTRAVNEPVIASMNLATANQMHTVSEYAAYLKHADSLKADVAKTAILTSGSVTAMANSGMVDMAAMISPSVTPRDIQPVTRPDMSWLSDVARGLAA